GHALIDLFFWRSAHHHDLHETGAGYASHDAAKSSLTANGVPSSSVQLTNPQRRPLKDSDCDIVMSLHSCGFHYPAATYGDFVTSALPPGGAFIFDMRKRSGQGTLFRWFLSSLRHSRYAEISAGCCGQWKLSPKKKLFCGAFSAHL